jgi:kumamolisin
VQLPASLAPSVLGVVGLASTVHMQPQYKLAPHYKSALQHPAVTSSIVGNSAQASCEYPYPTVAQFIGLYVDGLPLPFGYGGGPGCQGLTPAQTNSIYGAPNVGPRGKGAGVNLAVFELSAYLHSDIETWAHTFYGAHFTPQLVDITVDGGPLNPLGPCATDADFCPASFNGYSGDIEVDADIEQQLAISPSASHILVYNAPNDFSGQTTIDEYAQIANDDLADVVSASWGICENDQYVANAQAENLIFEQMALQGQSMFTAAGDTGAFDCIRANNTNVVNTEDPATQPWVTGVGGTSFGAFNPGTSSHPAYPTGLETVWNPGNLCNASPASPAEGDVNGFFWCAQTGAGGGGNSQFWGRPYFQFGPGITNPRNPYAQQCALAAAATECREVPDISANADEWTPYAEYCTGTPALPYSTCATFSGGQSPPGWFGIGGTSLSSPLLSAIIADRDSFQGTRTGNINTLLYFAYSVNPHAYFNDITGIGQTTNNNGLFPTVPGYDLATGVGTPKMAPIITGKP